MTEILHEEFETLGAGQNFCCSQTLIVQLHWRECFFRNCKSLWIFRSFYVACTMVPAITQIPTMHYGPCNHTKPYHALDKSSNQLPLTHQIPVPILFYHLHVYLAKRPQFNGFQNISFSYLLTPFNIVILEKLTGSQQVKKYPAFYGTRRFIAVFTRALQLSVS